MSEIRAEYSVRNGKIVLSIGNREIGAMNIDEVQELCNKLISLTCKARREEVLPSERRRTLRKH